MRDFEIELVSLRIACDISRACSAMWLSPISPSISAFGTRAATLSHDQNIDSIAADQVLRDFERLLAGVWLGDQEIVDVDADSRCECRIQRMFHVDISGLPAPLLRLGDDVLRER